MAPEARRGSGTDPGIQIRRIRHILQGSWKLLVVLVGAALLAAGIAACGGGDDPSSSTTEAARQGKASGDKSAKGITARSAQGEGSSKGSGSGKSDTGSGGEGSGKSASAFVPKHHSDSGGGSQQYRVKGGDNSVQEFGKEAAPSEFDEAAIALHNFLDARAEGNWSAACKYMSKGIVEGFEKLAERAESIKGTSCAKILEKLTNPAAKQALKEEAAKADVGSLRVEGDRSFLVYTGTEGTILAMPMANEKGAWKVSSLAGTPLN